MTERCHLCGRVKCETCGGSGVLFAARRACPYCEDGWLDDGESIGWRTDEDTEDGRHFTTFHRITGANPAVLCPNCKPKEE